MGNCAGLRSQSQVDGLGVPQNLGDGSLQLKRYQSVLLSTQGTFKQDNKNLTKK
jgi:hypothetical protein